MWLAATGAEELEGLNGYHAVLGLCIATVAGLLGAEIILRVAREALRGRFFSRFVAVVFGACIGGAFAVLLPALSAIVIGLAGSPGEALLPVVVSTLLGGLAGTVEGLILAFPLAVFLGRFGDRTAATSGS